MKRLLASILLAAAVLLGPATAAEARGRHHSSRRAPSYLAAGLPRIAWCESGNDYNAKNRHSSASGKWQLTDATFRAYRAPEGSQYAHNRDAPPRIQDIIAMRLYRARGTQPWVSSRPCWR